jgi:hypothetical protein
MYLENQGFAKFRVGRIPLSPHHNFILLVSGAYNISCPVYCPKVSDQHSSNIQNTSKAKELP